jgi:hypothetical protein
MLTCHQLGLGPKETPWFTGEITCHEAEGRPAGKPLPPPADTAACYMLEALNRCTVPNLPAGIARRGPCPWSISKTRNGNGDVRRQHTMHPPPIQGIRERALQAAPGRCSRGADMQGTGGHHHFRRIRRARRSPAAAGHMPVAASASQDLDHNSHKSARGKVVNSIHNHKQRDQ